MILLHRLSSFGIAFVAAVGFLLLLFSGLHPYLTIACTALLALLILGRLL